MGAAGDSGGTSSHWQLTKLVRFSIEKIALHARTKPGRRDPYINNLLRVIQGTADRGVFPRGQVTATLPRIGPNACLPRNIRGLLASAANVTTPFYSTTLNHDGVVNRVTMRLEKETRSEHQPPDQDAARRASGHPECGGVWLDYYEDLYSGRLLSLWRVSLFYYPYT